MEKQNGALARTLWPQLRACGRSGSKGRRVAQSALQEIVPIDAARFTALGALRIEKVLKKLVDQRVERSDVAHRVGEEHRRKC